MCRRLDVDRLVRREGRAARNGRARAGGAPLANPAFAVAPAGFNALVAWNAAELGLDAEADELAEALAARWDGDLTTWVDDGPSAATSGPGAHGSTRCSRRSSSPTRTSAALERPTRALLDPAAFGGSVRAGRGPPRPSRRSTRRVLAGSGLAAADLPAVASRRRPRSARHWWPAPTRSGLAEHWHPDTGEGLGARPQSWAGLAILALLG